MKPCAGKQKLITWLTLDALDARSAQELRVHLETCPGCRAYLAEISQVTKQLSCPAPTSEVHTSELFHRQVMNRIRAEKPISRLARLTTWFQSAHLNWHVALPATAVVLLLLTLWINQSPRSVALLHPVVPVAPAAPLTAASAASPEVAPTIANYQRIASQSLEQLDEVLVHQERSVASSTPVCTAAAISLTF